MVFDPWWQASWDVNDTVSLDPKTDLDVGGFFRRLPDADYLPTWHKARENGQFDPEEQDAAQKAAAHAGTPTVAHFDTLGRTFLTIADNGVDRNNVPQKYPIRLELDIEGNHLTTYQFRKSWS